MLFNSLAFGVFLPVVFFAYWFVVAGSIRRQNAFIVVASYFFYGWWDWRFLALLILSTLVDYRVGLAISQNRNQNVRRRLLWISVFTNLGTLGFFKYFDFFVENFLALTDTLGFGFSPTFIRVVFPVGISFYTFQTLSYTIDVYHDKIKAEPSPVNFAAYVSFFPQLVAGPIEQSTTLLPQFSVRRRFDFDSARDGCRQALWGFFKKLVIADNCAMVVNQVFENYADAPSSALLVGAFCFTIQIYSDFSGYSDIAIGVSRLFGFQLMKNFAYPAFSRDIVEFWRRWHISLSAWFREYLFAPLGGLRGSKVVQIRNVLILFTVIGFWHGANWTFIVFGFLHGVWVVVSVAFRSPSTRTEVVAEGRWFPSPFETGSMIATFGTNCLLGVFFRSPNISTACSYLCGIADISTMMVFPSNTYAIPHCCVLLLIEWIQRERNHGLDIGHLSLPLRWCIYYLVILGIVVFGEFGGSEFVYFQF